jgi:hypothetical protein
VQDLDDLERAVLEMLLVGDHPALVVLRRQMEHVSVAGRETTGVGFFCDLSVDDGCPTVDRDFHLGDVHAEIEGLAHGAGFVLFVRGGRLSLLEGFSYDEPWPDTVRSFSLRYLDPQRESVLAAFG